MPKRGERKAAVGQGGSQLGGGQHGLKPCVRQNPTG